MKFPPVGNASNSVLAVNSTGLFPDEPVVTQTFDADGRLASRVINDASISPPHAAENPIETLLWGYNSRLLALNTDFNSLAKDCTPPNQPWPATYSPNHNEWTYRYNSQGLRELKRLMRAPRHDSAECSGIMPWTYYVRGLSGDELVVYQGRQVKRVGYNLKCEGVQDEYGDNAQRLVYLYPVEYRAYGASGLEIMWKRDVVTGDLSKRFISTDLRGSIIGIHNGADVLTEYHPFGYPVDVVADYNTTWDNRTGWLDRETDHESAKGNRTLSYIDVNARKYIPRHGQFASVDEYWSSQTSVSPYHYANHDPINFVDPSGYKLFAVPLTLIDFLISSGSSDDVVAGRPTGGGAADIGADPKVVWISDGSFEKDMAEHRAWAAAALASWEAGHQGLLGASGGGLLGPGHSGNGGDGDWGVGAVGIRAIVTERPTGFGPNNGVPTDVTAGPGFDYSGTHIVTPLMYTRERIASTAEKHIDSKAWNYDVVKDNFDVNTNKCNKFVYDVVAAAGADPGLPHGNTLGKIWAGLTGGEAEGSSPPTAEDWANPEFEIPGWEVVEVPRRGDVAAQNFDYPDATGHVAIVVDANVGLTVGTDHGRKIGLTNWGFRSLSDQGGVVVFRRWVGVK